MSNDDSVKRAEFVAGLREMADFYETSGFPVPSWMFPSIRECAFTSEEAASGLRALGTFTKSKDDSGILCTRAFGPLTVSLRIMHDGICKKVKREKLVTVEEWECPPSLLALAETLNEAPEKK